MEPNVFKSFLKSNIFKDRKVLSADWIPNRDLVIRLDDKIQELGQFLAPLLKNEKPPNCIIYGPSGVGKTLIVFTIKNELEEMKPKTNSKFQMVYIKCGEYPTEFGLLYKTCKMLDLGYKGTSKGRYYELIKKHTKDEIVVLIIDEIDKLKNGNEPIFNLTRIPNLSIVGIANKLTFTEDYESRTKSSLCERNILLSPYNALELANILRKREKLSFNKGVLEPGVIPKCAALGAQEHGDARKALDLLKGAGEAAEKTNSNRVTGKHIDIAEDVIDLDIITEAVRNKPRQSQAVLTAIIKLAEEGYKSIQTGDVFSVYEGICKDMGLKVLTQRRISDLISDLDMAGVINARIFYKGRYGRTREIKLLLGKSVLERVKTILQQEELYLPHIG